MHRRASVREVTSEEDPYGWYRKGPISPDFKIDEVLPHLSTSLWSTSMKRLLLPRRESPSSLPASTCPTYTDRTSASIQGASGINPYLTLSQCDHHMGQLFSALKENGIDEHPRCFHYRQWMFAPNARRIEKVWP